jgi:Ca2+-binding RTX toxin-like protein
MAHITAANSVYQPSGYAFTGTGPDTLTVDADAFLISAGGGTGATLTGSWNAIVNGQIGAFDDSGIIFSSVPSDVVNITIGGSGDVFGSDRGLRLTGATATIFNKGTISGGSYSIYSAGLTKVTNIGTLSSDVLFTGVHDDIFTNFKKIGTVIKSGTLVGTTTIDLGDGADKFFGGAKAEIVRDGLGGDTYSFGGGSDGYLAVRTTGGVDGLDAVNGGSGTDTYLAYNATSSVTIALNLGQAFGDDIGFDNIAGFENASGGSGDDSLLGNNGANTLDGSAGLDYLDGHGGRDVLSGGADADKFHFTKLSDTGTKASTRDVITDFTPGVDKIDLSDIDAISKTKAVIDGFDLTLHNGFDGFTQAGQLRFRYTDGGNTIIYGDVNGDHVADFSIKLLGHILLYGTDFMGVGT